MRGCVIFDMDGVLIDSQPLHFQIDREVLKTAGASPNAADVERRAGMIHRERWAAYKQDFSLSLAVDDLIGMNLKALMETFEKADLHPVHGVVKLLRLLKDSGIQTVVASSSAMPLIGLILDRLCITEYFDAVITAEDVQNGKPAPDVFLKAAQTIGCRPDNCTVIEDSSFGILAAKRAHMFCIAYDNPTSGKQDLSAADRIIRSFQEINNDLNWLKN